MCSRYEFGETPKELAARFRLTRPPPLPNTDIIRPADQALIVAAGGETRLMGWGLEVTWESRPLINARTETLAEKRTFRPLLGNRCLVPAVAYFEWRRHGGAKLKNRIAPEGGGLFAFAGLGDGSRFTIVTCGPAESIAHIHDRMPVILGRSAEARWLDPETPFEAMADVLVPYAESPLEADEETPPPQSQPDLFG